MRAGLSFSPRGSGKEQRRETPAAKTAILHTFPLSVPRRRRRKKLITTVLTVLRKRRKNCPHWLLCAPRHVTLRKQPPTRPRKCPGPGSDCAVPATAAMGRIRFGTFPRPACGLLALAALLFIPLVEPQRVSPFRERSDPPKAVGKASRVHTSHSRFPSRPPPPLPRAG